MKRTNTGSSRRPKGRGRPVVVLKKGALDHLFADTGLGSYEARAEELGISVGCLHRAGQGMPVGGGVIGAIKLRFPAVAYEESFQEVVVLRAAA